MPRPPPLPPTLSEPLPLCAALPLPPVASVPEGAAAMSSSEELSSLVLRETKNTRLMLNPEMQSIWI